MKVEIDFTYMLDEDGSDPKVLLIDFIATCLDTDVGPCVKNYLMKSILNPLLHMLSIESNVRASKKNW